MKYCHTDPDKLPPGLAIITRRRLPRWHRHGLQQETVHYSAWGSPGSKLPRALLGVASMVELKHAIVLTVNDHVCVCGQ